MAATLAVLAAVPPKSVVGFLALPFIVLFVFAVLGTAGPVQRALASPAMQWGGRVSYSVYLTHFLVLVVLEDLGVWQRVASAPLIVRLATLAGGLALVVAVGAATHRLVEEPARRALRHVRTGRTTSAGRA
ncbi:acyltransferase family protein [Actinomycetospora aeridis]|uniref:Acyltransferase-like protein n=1 Tax=Actinomycetospora aeridis TaxID=3129231 RepID=A0ABU8N6A3_9PSEU